MRAVGGFPRANPARRVGASGRILPQGPTLTGGHGTRSLAAAGPASSGRKLGNERIPRGNRTFVVWRCKPSQELACELRKRIVARAHHHDAIARTGQPDQQVATGGTVRKSKGLAATALDFAHDRVAADAAVDRAAEV